MYLTHSINADISFVLRAGGAVFDLAGHGEEEVVVFCDAVQLADVLICTETNKHTETLISIKISNCCIKDANFTDSPKFSHEPVNLKLPWLLYCNLLHIQYSTDPAGPELEKTGTDYECT